MADIETPQVTNDKNKIVNDTDDDVSSRPDSPDNLDAEPELLIKHPLQNSWTLWFFKNDKNRNWEDNQRSIITFILVCVVARYIHHFLGECMQKIKIQPKNNPVLNFRMY